MRVQPCARSGLEWLLEMVCMVGGGCIELEHHREPPSILAFRIGRSCFSWLSTDHVSFESRVD